MLNKTPEKKSKKITNCQPAVHTICKCASKQVDGILPSRQEVIVSAEKKRKEKKSRTVFN